MANSLSVPSRRSRATCFSRYSSISRKAAVPSWYSLQDGAVVAISWMARFIAV
ncbi:Uncharacterised protein [Mycobacteroides abscessus subsp. abscessus]|nr:Uncharacterised protein [Mycobacteroides abscessus subsp. abscessus]